MSESPILWPVLDGKGRLYPIYSKYEKFTYGVTIKTDNYAKIIAVADGIITDVSYDECSCPGLIVEITHNNKFKTIYKNLFINRLKIVGKKVKQGDIIGYSKTGASNLECSDIASYDLDKYLLHYFIIKGTTKIDPRELLYKLNGAVYIKSKT